MFLKRKFKVGNKWVGEGHPALIIAEAGVNHFGDAGKARDLVHMAAEAGADVFKTQAFTTEELISQRLPEWRQRMKPKEVGLDFLLRMKEECDTHNILFMCTAHDRTALPWLEELKVPAFKIGSGERENFPFLQEIIRFNKPILLSTGMYNVTHLQNTIRFFEQTTCKELALLHCVTSYPTPVHEVNLNAMDLMREIFPGPVGYSDHTEGHVVTLAAVAKGAQLIEKHITLDFNVPNAQDWKVSAGPDDFKTLIQHIRVIEQALGKKVKETQACEKKAEVWALKSIVAKKDIPQGTVLSEDLLTFRRPGDGLPPSRLPELLGKKVQKAIGADQLILLEDIV